MRSNVKNRALALLAGVSVLCLGGAIVCYTANDSYKAKADEEVNYYAFVDVGASADGKLADEALGLTEKGATLSTDGTLHSGDTLFESYRENAAYSLALAAGTYQVAVAVQADADTAITVGGASVAVEGTGKLVATTTATVSGSSLSVEVTGKLCGILVADEGSKVLMTADYTPGQVIPYGALLAEVLDGATGYYSDGSTAELKIEYGDINAATGVNVNFTTIDVTGTVEGTELTVTRYLTTMPDELVYFINSGSYTTDGNYPNSADDKYSYNQTVFDYYKNTSGALINDGTPDRISTDENSWGLYNTNMLDHGAPGDATFPYNSFSYYERGGDVNMGYRLTNLTPEGAYRIWIGSCSHWHARSATITFNGEVVGSDSLRMNSSKGFSIYENVPADANGKIDIFMRGADTNEPTICFIAVQKMETVIPAVPSNLEGAPTIGLEDTAMTFTAGVTPGAKIQLYNEAKPTQVLYEEMVDSERIDGDGLYVLDWGKVFEGISRFNAVQITAGGVSEPLTVSITDIEEFAAHISPEGYTTGAVTVTLTAHADSGIASWSYQQGEYGVVNTFELDLPYALNASFVATENDDYIIVITSGLGVTYSEVVTVSTIDPDNPVITITPSKEGWNKGAYNVTLSVTSIAPVAEYRLFKGGKQIAAAETAPATITFTETGEYLVTVKTAAGQATTRTVTISDTPTTTKVTRTYANRTLTFTFEDTENYKVASVLAYEVTEEGTSRMTISSGNSFDVYSAGTYVVTITTENGTVEMFSLEIAKEDFKASKGGGGNVALGVGIGVGVGGVVIAAAAITVCFVLLKKKKS